jgi:hypothetical protein
LALQKQALVDQVLTPEIRAQLAEIDAEFAGKAAEANDKAADLEAEVKQAIIDRQASVKGTYIHAIWVKGRVSWESKLLEGYMTAHPEIAAFRHEGDPSVSLRSVK